VSHGVATSWAGNRYSVILIFGVRQKAVLLVEERYRRLPLDGVPDRRRRLIDLVFSLRT
jgi:hypothetical protein